MPASGDVDRFDGHLLPTSPALDSGTAIGAPEDDLDGNERDSLPDIGAYEGTAYIFADGFEDGDPGFWSYAVSTGDLRINPVVSRPLPGR